MSIRLFYSKPAMVITYLAIPVILVSQYSRFSALGIVIQSLVYMAIAYNAECLVEGGCDLWAWISVALPILYSLVYIVFKDKFNLEATPPSPFTNIMPISRKITAKLLPDESSNTDSVVAANTDISGEPQSGSGQPTTTTGNISEAFQM